jgi:hypothetical protein
MTHITMNRPHTQAKRPTNLVIDYIPDGPGSGSMSIAVRNRPTVYKIRELKCSSDFPGRGFRCEKVFGGTDPEAEAYDVFLSHNRDADICGCKGLLRHGHCKHLDALAQLIHQGAIDLGTEFSDHTEPEPTPACEYCAGRGVVHDEDHPDLPKAIACPECNGTGILTVKDVGFTEFSPGFTGDHRQDDVSRQVADPCEPNPYPEFRCPICTGTATLQLIDGNPQFVCFDCTRIGKVGAA